MVYVSPPTKILNISNCSLLESSGGLEVPKKQRGSSHSTRPVSKRPPIWCKYKPEEVEALVIKLAKDGNSPSKIGTILRDQHGIPLAKSIMGKTVTKILKDAELAPSLPEDLEMLLKKAARLHVHLEKNNKDLHNKRALQIIEAKIHKLSRYYRNQGALPVDWKYKAKGTALI